MINCISLRFTIPLTNFITKIVIIKIANFYKNPLVKHLILSKSQLKNVFMFVSKVPKHYLYLLTRQLLDAMMHWVIGDGQWLLSQSPRYIPWRAESGDSVSSLGTSHWSTRVKGPWTPLPKPSTPLSSLWLLRKLIIKGYGCPQTYFFGKFALLHYGRIL